MRERRSMYLPFDCGSTLRSGQWVFKMMTTGDIQSPTYLA